MRERPAPIAFAHAGYVAADYTPVNLIADEAAHVAPRSN